MLKYKNYRVYLIIILIVVLFNYGALQINAFIPDKLSYINSTDVGHLFQLSGNYQQIGVTCDINGDGYTDIIQGYLTQALVYFGKSSFSNLTTPLGVNGFQITVNSGQSYNINCGDVNNDGYDDILINSMSPSSGVLYVVYGKSSGFSALWDIASAVDGTNVLAMYGVSNQVFGFSTGIADFNGDGLNDLMIGCSIGTFGGSPAPGYNNIYVIYGINGGKFPYVNSGEFNLTTLNGKNGIKIPNKSSYYLQTFDINGDGISDIISNRDNIYFEIIYGSKNISVGVDGLYNPLLDGGQNGFTISSPISIQSNSFITFGVGDFNGDGHNDIAYPGSTGTDKVLLVLLGPFTRPLVSSTINSTNSIRIKTTASAICQSVFLNDINGDGLADLQCYFMASSPVFYTVFGKQQPYTPYNGVLGFTTNPDLQNPCDGFYISPLSMLSNINGDMNNDGLMDFVVTSNSYLYVIYSQQYYGISLPSTNASKITIQQYTNSTTYQIFNTSSNIVGSTYPIQNTGQCAYKFIQVKILNPKVGDSLIFNNPNTSLYSTTSNSTATAVTIYLADGQRSDQLILSSLRFISFKSGDLNSNRVISLLVNNIIDKPIYVNMIGVPRANDEPSQGDDNTHSKTNVGVIVGPIVGGVAVLCAFIVAFILYKRKNKKNKNQAQQSKEDVQMNKI